MNTASPSLISPLISRRRFISIVGSFSAASLLTTALPPSADCSSVKSTFRWAGTALGATAFMTLIVDKQDQAQKLFAQCIAEIARLEKIFSLFVPDSTIRRLNQAGILLHPPAELVEVISEAQRLSVLSEGAFDISIQPLWHYLYYLDTAPQPERIASLRKLIDYRKIHVSSSKVWFAQPGMQITLNGIAQGYITDKVTALLKENGLTHVLVELGESYALGQNSNGTPWRIGIQDPETFGLVKIVELQNRALATSGAYGTPFKLSQLNRGQSTHHLINASTASAAHLYKSLSVSAKTALHADGLSTTLSLIEKFKHNNILQHYPDAQVVHYC